MLMVRYCTGTVLKMRIRAMFEVAGYDRNLPVELNCYFYVKNIDHLDKKKKKN
jgi:hypothetical protein